MIDPVYKRLLAENAWLKQQIALLQESNSLHDDVDKMSLAEKKKYYNAIRREKVSDQEDAVERKERLALIRIV